MPVEIRELVLRAQVLEGAPPWRGDRPEGIDAEDLRARILAECERMIRAAIERQATR